MDLECEVDFQSLYTINVQAILYIGGTSRGETDTIFPNKR